jgi:hypothetical protein
VADVTQEARDLAARLQAPLAGMLEGRVGAFDPEAHAETIRRTVEDLTRESFGGLPMDPGDIEVTVLPPEPGDDPHLVRVSTRLSGRLVSYLWETGALRYAPEGGNDEPA